MDKKCFGILEGIIDYEFYINLFYIFVYYLIEVFYKIDIEVLYYVFINGGYIFYIEFDGDFVKNILVFEVIIKYMVKKGIGYGFINYLVDFDFVCKYVGIINEECLKCGWKEILDVLFDRIRRIIGYLVGILDCFNNVKKKEVEECVKYFYF